MENIEEARKRGEFVINRSDLGLRIIVKTKKPYENVIVFRCLGEQEWFNATNILPEIYSGLKDLWVDEEELMGMRFPINVLNERTYSLNRPWRLEYGWRLKADCVIPWSIIPRVVEKTDDGLSKGERLIF